MPCRRRSLVAPLLAVAATSFALGSPRAASAGDSPAPPAPAAAGPTVEVPTGIPISLDGRPLPGEWDDAAVVVPPQKGFELKMKHARGTLMLSLRIGRPWKPTWRFLFRAVAGADAGPADAQGAVQLDVEPFEHNRPHALVQVRSEKAWERADDRVVVRTAGLDEGATLEAAIPLSLLGAGGEEPTATPPPPLRWLAAFTTPGRAPSVLVFPEGLDLVGGPNTRPADLLTTARWAVTPKFAQAFGRGAFSKTDWDALVAAGHELTARGEAAHRAVLEWIGAFETNPIGERMKEDGPLVRAIADFDWVAGREPWTHADARMYATALRQLNRAPEAFATMRTLAQTSSGPETPADVHAAASAARQAERFADSAALWERAALLLPPPIDAQYHLEAERMRAWGAAKDAEERARREDDAKDDLPVVILKTTKGPFVVRLLEDECPESAKQFIHLAEGPDGKPFYDGTRFHRVVAPAAIEEGSAGLSQGGDPTSRGDGCKNAGQGKPSWWIPMEKSPRHHFLRGAVGWATAQDERVGSQFFVITGPQLAYDGRFSCFGTVIAGMDVVDRLEVCDELISVRVVRKRDHPYVPKKQPW